MLYRVRIGDDEYVGQAEEVVAFMARAEGAPGTREDVASYMEGVARRLSEKLGVEGVQTADPAAFLDSLDAQGIVPIETFTEPSDEYTSPEEALGDGPVGLGDGVDPEDLDL